MSGNSGFWKGTVVGFLLCAALLAVGAGIAWVHRYRLAEKVAPTQLTSFAGSFFRALPEGYVTKKKEYVMEVLDEFTNSLGRANISDGELRSISMTLLRGVEDGSLSYEELDELLEKMRRAAASK